MQPVRLPTRRAPATLALALASVTVSCSFNPSSLSGGIQPDGAVDPIPDASASRPDADPDAPDARVTAPDAGMVDAMAPDEHPRCEEWPSPRHFEPCAIPLPSSALVLDQSGDYTYDTNTATLRAPSGGAIAHAQAILAGNPEVRLVSVERLVVGVNARLRVTGDRPLLVGAWSEIVVDGRIDVGSSRASRGAGANTGTCSAAGPGQPNANAGGGGGGGGLAGNGGNGGAGSGGGSGGGRGAQVAAPTTVRGGCDGGAGGRGDQGNGAGAGGDGGGALQLTAQTRVTINGRLHAGGAGGGGASASSGRRAGGGGGGSGGLIGLEAPMLVIGPGAILAANGGGGGEGAEDGNGDPGDDGQLGAAAAAGGSGNDRRGGDGGAGGAQASASAGNGSNGSNNGSNRGGGGGGGGGVGYVIFEGTASVAAGAVLSPAPVTR